MRFNYCDYGITAVRYPLLISSTLVQVLQRKMAVTLDKLTLELAPCSNRFVHCEFNTVEYLSGPPIVRSTACYLYRRILLHLGCGSTSESIFPPACA